MEEDERFRKWIVGVILLFAVIWVGVTNLWQIPHAARSAATAATTDQAFATAEEEVKRHLRADAAAAISESAKQQMATEKQEIHVLATWLRDMYQSASNHYHAHGEKDTNEAWYWFRGAQQKWDEAGAKRLQDVEDETK